MRASLWRASTGVTAFRIRDAVRLVDQHGDIPAGTTGSVLGWFVSAGERTTYVVNFAAPAARVAEVHAAEIVIADSRT